MEKDIVKFKESYKEYLEKRDNDYIIDIDSERNKQIKQFNDIINQFLNSNIDLTLFKEKINSLTARNKKYWGFSGFSGQMFFNMLYNSSENLQELEVLLKECIEIPINIQDAKNKISLLEDYIWDIRETIDDIRRAPKIKSILFFLSFFWQLQDKNKYPIFYNKSEQSLFELNLLDDFDNIQQLYENFFEINYLLKEYVEKEFNIQSSLYDIEHALYFYATYEEEQMGNKIDNLKAKLKPQYKLEFVPPYFNNLTKLAIESDNKENIKKFEEKVGKLFSVLGFEVIQKGQGTGREPDGLALSYDERYCIIFDTKIRNDKYRIGTDDRKIIDYIDSVKRKYKNRFTNYYFVLISSQFADETDKIGEIRRVTGINSIKLIKASVLLNLLNYKFKEDINLNKLQRLFDESGELTVEELQ